MRSELLVMSDLGQPVYLTPEGRPWIYIRVEGEEVTRHEAGRQVVQGIRLQYGEFGLAEERMVQQSGGERGERYNVNGYIKSCTKHAFAFNCRRGVVVVVLNKQYCGVSYLH